MRLTLGKANATHATLYMDGIGTITVSGDNATALALQLARAFNRDSHFEALIAALTPFRSREMGGLLIGMIDIREHGGEEAQRRLGQHISMIDVILDAAERTELNDDGDEDDASHG